MPMKALKVLDKRLPPAAVCGDQIYNTIPASFQLAHTELRQIMHFISELNNHIEKSIIIMFICAVFQGKDDPSNWDITELKQNLQARFIPCPP
jgi:hypothetical protein